jgi:hypothetical protein
MLNIEIKLYEFNELNELSQNKAINTHREFLLSVLQPDYIDGICDWDDVEKMTMYHEEYGYLEEHDEPIIENIEINEYLYFYDGTLAHSVYYTAGDKKGNLEIIIHGETYTKENYHK